MTLDKAWTQAIDTFIWRMGWKFWVAPVALQEVWIKALENLLYNYRRRDASVVAERLKKELGVS